MRAALLWAVVAACAQASGTQQQIQQDASESVPHDARSVTPGDAPNTSPMDARPLDAFVYKDAPPLGQEGDTCQANNECDAAAGLCCYLVFCVKGTAFGAACFPS